VSRTNGSRLDHVADGEALDGLVLWCAARAVGAADWLDVATSLLVATAVRSLCQSLCLVFLPCSPSLGNTHLDALFLTMLGGLCGACFVEKSYWRSVVVDCLPNSMCAGGHGGTLAEWGYVPRSTGFPPRRAATGKRLGALLTPDPDNLTKQGRGITT